MISINDLTLSFGGTTLLDHIGFHINDKDRIGLVGRNGAGKSTILKLIMGLQVPTSGQIVRPSDLRIGYLPQVMDHPRGRTVMAETMRAFEEFHRLNDRLDAVSRQIAERTDYESESYRNLIIEMAQINDELAMMGSETPEMQAERTLSGLGFRREDFERPTETVSQGWNMRIELAKILLRKPDVLLLDEPTNHLDIESIQWLEDYLREFTGALVLISHDRRFLDNCTERTVEVMLGHIYDYKVPYSKFTVLRAERIAQQKAAYANQQRMIEKTEDFIAKFRYKPTKSNQVQSRIKQLEKLERIEIDDEDLVQMSIKFPPAPRSGDVAFLVKDAVIGYPDNGKVILRDVNITVKRGEKVAFVGRNGEGKTTMMRVLMGELEPFEGQAGAGYNVNVGYYAQNQNDVLRPNDTVYDTLERVAVGEMRTRLRDLLGAFLFRGDDIDKKVSVLSGGERSRLALARLMLHPYNLLALDEPTNHMDIRAKDVLKQALLAYDGTLIVVSHDRDFLSGLVTKIYEFADGRVREHLGGVDDFLRRKKAESFRDIERAAAPAKPATAAPAASETPQPRTGQQDYNERKAQAREDKRIQNRRNALEKQIASIEEQMSAIEKVLEAPAADTDIMQLTRDYLELKRDLDYKMNEWAEL
ncbi:MAG: ABC-F family ATP-binding cassette domain-containing protein [Bacteroidales bacterium]|nr:ABC-F family ATP-binding cassette domain-containing protein [Bacteroidales bacterium]